MRSVEERLAAMEAKICAHDAALKRERDVSAQALMRAEEVLTKRFEAANEIRQAMEDRERYFVTTGEFRWAIGAVILVLIGMLFKVLS